MGKQVKKVATELWFFFLAIDRKFILALRFMAIAIWPRRAYWSNPAKLLSLTEFSNILDNNID